MKFNEDLFSWLEAPFSDLGFKKAIYFEHNGLFDFEKESEDSIQWIRMAFDITKKGFVRLDGYIQFKPVVDVLEKFVTIKEEFKEEIVGNYPLYKQKQLWISECQRLSNLPLNSSSDLDNFKIKIFSHIRDFILPFFDEYHSLQAVNDKIINEVQQNEYSNFIPGKTNFKVLIILRMAQNPKYEEFRDWALKAYQKGVELDAATYQKEYDTLVRLTNYLDKEGF
ncbi:MAG TPA: hypothetical protein DCE41_26760 [Cytophagales bacterium]|nr:hypothetical protein [Cytophagales bacterium]HAA21879.1 hypothetical protein [Cytophagales bacterium]HAP58264.1 hypothetical protein [Cytophagales bacterium]